MSDQVENPNKRFSQEEALRGWTLENIIGQIVIGWTQKID